MSTTTDAHKAEIAGRRYATKFYVETAANGRPLDPTNANLAEILSNCSLRPRPEWYDAIRRELAERYDVRTTVERIIAQGGTNAELSGEIASILKSRKTTELMDDYRETRRVGGEDATEVRRWITAELIDRIGREPTIAFEQRVRNEAKERAIPARDARRGDVHVIRANRLYMRHEVVDVRTRRKGTIIDLTYKGHTSSLLGSDQSIVVEREDDEDEPA